MYWWRSKCPYFRIFFHVFSVENQSNVLIRTADTDCLIIGFWCPEKLDPSLKIWLEFGVPSKNNIRFISVDSIYSNLGKHFYKALPLKKSERDVQAQIALGNLAKVDDDQSNDFTETEKFTCKMYRKKILKKIDDVRTEIFMERYKSKTDEDKSSCAKKTWWQYDAAMWTCFAKQNKANKVCCKNLDVIDWSFAP